MSLEVVWIKTWPLSYVVGGPDHNCTFILVLALSEVFVYLAAEPK